MDDPFGGDSYPRELRKLLKDRGIETDGYGLIDGSWGTPLLPIDRKGADALFQVVTSRYEQGSILLTTNRPFRQWGAIMNQDNTLASALIDRLGHHAEVVLVEGKSYRMKGKEKEEDVDGKK